LQQRENKMTVSDETKFLFDIEFGLGAWAWGDRVFWNYGQTHTDDDIKNAFESSLDAGISFLDTAEVYGQGRSETLIGELLKTTKKPTVIATKFMPFPWRLRKSSLIKALKHSLDRLGLQSVDLYQIHWPFPPFPIEHWVEALAEAKQQGLTRAVGVSNYNKNQMQRAYTVLAKYNIPLASNQVEYSLLDRRIETNGVLQRSNELGVRIISYSPLAKGLLTGKYSQEKPPPGVRGRQSAGKLKEIQPLLKLMTEMGQDLGGKTPSQIALNWLICKGTMPIPGAKNGLQAEMNAGATGWRLDEGQIKALDSASDKFTK
jgi:aryl-alcohol dehydrogenase-like predicted oxidoreductase